MTILLLNGPNLNMLGRRDPLLYGSGTLSELEQAATAHAAQYGVRLVCRQSNSEGQLIDILQQTQCDGVVLNAGAYSHYSYALRDCIECLGVPVCEVHITDTSRREPFRQVDVLADVCACRIVGRGVQGYLDAIDFLVEHK